MTELMDQPVIEVAHAASVLSRRLNELTEEGPEIGRRNGAAAQPALLLARKAIFEELAPYRSTWSEVTGDRVVDAVAAFLYARGHDKHHAEVSADRLAPLTPSSSTGSQEVVLTHRNPFDNRVGVVGTTKRRGVRVIAPTLDTDQWDIARPFANLYVPFADPYFSACRGSGWVSCDSIYDVSESALPVLDLAIFDDPEETAAYALKNPHGTYMLVGQKAVFQLLSEGNQNALAVKSLLEAYLTGAEKPNLDGLDVDTAIAGRLRNALTSEYLSLPAEAHPDILNQVDSAQFFRAAVRAAEAMEVEDFAKSSRLHQLKLNRKTMDRLTEVVDETVASFTRGMNESITEVTLPQSLLKATLKKRFATSLEEHMPYNHHYEYTVTGFGRYIQRRAVRRILRSYHA